LGFARSKSGTWLLLAGLLTMAADGLCAADLFVPATGNLLGSVIDSSGIPQIGASVKLFNKYDRLLAKTLTSGDGRFAFADLPSDSYSVRVSVPSFLPAARNKIQVKAGEDSILQIHLATLLSSIEVRYAPPTAVMSEDWKWVLRSSPALRPVTRFLPVETAKTKPEPSHTRIFSDTRAVMSLSGGDTGIIDSDYAATGTRFALSTFILGTNQLRVSGTYGQGDGVMPPAISVSAVYSRAEGQGFIGAPELGFSVSQLAFAGGSNLAGQGTGSPSSLGPLAQVHAMSVRIYQTADPTDNLHIEYGASGESVDVLQHTSRFSPFARVSADLGRTGELVAAYSDGNRPDALLDHPLEGGQRLEGQSSEGLSENPDSAPGITTRLPQMAYRNGRLRLQRTQSYELGYSKTTGPRTYAVSAFYENVSDGRLNVAGDLGGLDPGNLLSDGISSTSIYDVGHYSRSGYLASANQQVNEFLDVGVAYGRLGGFSVDGYLAPSFAASSSARRFVQQENHNTAAVDVKAKAPVVGTRILVNYGWVDGNAVIPRHVFVTQNSLAQPGFNILLRQPLPQICNIGGRFELTADLYNLLAQGYLPVNSGDGQKLLIVQAPRAIRGGLKFVF